ncbi:MAG TPA: cellulase family glycosylhydrolase [Bacteroidales bacterium]|nr:cellulase family glycosylhydrolase [Bacteroidales bacterium]
MQKLRLIIILSSFFLQCFVFSGCEHESSPLVFSEIDLYRFSREHKGFNLLGKYDIGWSDNGFTEEEFAIVKDLGFNFVRLPLDYRTYTQSGNWDVFIEDKLAEIDKALEYADNYGVHVCICLHRAPGYCVNPAANLPANQNIDLWSDATAQKAFLNHWEYLSRRYKDIAWEKLSFNLVNEPKDIDESVYVTLMKKAIDRIQAVQPDRIIFVDGLNYSRQILNSFSDRKNIIQAVHVYDPMQLTHYKAEWVSGADNWPLPVWPMTDINMYLFGPWQSKYQSSLVIKGTFPKDMEVFINVRQVSVQAKLEMKLDNNIIYSKSFVCNSEPGVDWTQIISTQWGYQNISNKDYGTTLPATGSKLTFSVTSGDWISFNRLILKYPDNTFEIIPANTEWGTKQSEYTITAEGKITDTEGTQVVPLGNLAERLKSAESQGIPVMVQEFGVYNKTPHKVSVDYLNDVVSIFNSHHIGYSMWNMIGTMGIINSGRTDCDYENYRGKSLDRQMTEIIRKTGK